MTLLSLCLVAASAGEAETASVRFYVGTYTGGKSKGIYHAELDRATGALSRPALVAELEKPSFLAIHPGGKSLYSVCEIGDFRGKKAGAVAAFALEESGALRLLNQEASGGVGPCHVNVDPSGRSALVANYGSGSVAALPLLADGRLGPASSTVQHRGSGPNRGRQEGPHAHSFNLDPSGRFAFACDLGLDKVLIYRLDAERAELRPHDPPFAVVPPGSGPRHFAFHPNGKRAYAINELSSTITVFAYDSERGTLEPLQNVATLPKDFRGSNTTADIHVHPSGKFVYGSNRGHDSIAWFAVDGEGRLAAKGHVPTGGKTPRNFALDPSGRFLLAANQDSDNIVPFRIDGESGEPEPNGEPIEVGRPVCIRFVAR